MKEATTWVVAGPADALACLAPLISAHRHYRAVRVVEGADVRNLDLDDAAGALIVGDRKKSPRSAVPGPFLRDRTGRRVPTGWLPDIQERLGDFAKAAAEVQLRWGKEADAGPFVLLGESTPRAAELAGRVADHLIPRAPVFRWTEERIRRQDLIAALRGGVGAAIYLGRGTSAGWAAYRGFDAGDAVLARGRPLGAVLSLTCSVSSRARRALSFSEELVVSGFCAATLGAAGLTLHSSNAKLGVAIAEILRGTPMTLADLLLAPGIRPALLSRYRITGDPLAPLLGDTDSLEKAHQVFAPVPGEVLPVIPLSSWS